VNKKKPFLIKGKPVKNEKWCMWLLILNNKFWNYNKVVDKNEQKNICNFYMLKIRDKLR